MTWKDVQVASLQKMFAISGSDIVRDDSTEMYLAAMPHAANEGLYLLATAGKGLVRRLDIVNSPQENLLGRDAQKQRSAKELAFAATGQSYYFEVTGPCEVNIGVENGATRKVSVPAGKQLAVYRGNVNNPQGHKVHLTFAGQCPFVVRNVALYGAAYASENDVPSPADEQRYPLRQLAPDFYKLKADNVLLDGAPPVNRVYRFEGEDVMVLPRGVQGTYSVYYYAYPAAVNAATPEDAVMELAREEAALLPLYIAGQLYKDDDAALATMYRNEFEVGLERLRGNTTLAGEERFVSSWV